MSLLRLAIVIVASFHASSAMADLIPYRKGLKWGYADTSGKIIVKPVYDWVSHYGEGSYIVKLNSKYGLLGPRGNALTKTVYDRMKLTFSPECIIVTHQNKMGVINNAGKIVIPITYEEVDDYPHDQYIRFVQGNRIGLYSPFTKKTRYIVIDDNEIAEMKMTEEESTSVSYDTTHRYVSVVQRNRFRVLSEEIVKTWQGGRNVRTNVRRDTIAHAFDKAIARNLYGCSFTLVKTGKLWGVVFNRTLAIAPRYDSIREDLINDSCKKFYLIVARAGKWGIVDFNGNELVSPAHEEIVFPSLMQQSGMTCFNTNDGIVVRSKQNFGLISLHGEILLPVEQESIDLKTGKIFYTYVKGVKKGVYSEAFKTDLIFGREEEFGGLYELHGVKYMKLIDSKRTVQDENGSSETFLKGYVSQEGIRFFEE